MNSLLSIAMFNLPLAQAEKAADRLVLRDREADDRALCRECAHLQGRGRWRCENWPAADVAHERLGPDLITLLQRCPGIRLSDGGREDGQLDQGG